MRKHNKPSRPSASIKPTDPLTPSTIKPRLIAWAFPFPHTAQPASSTVAPITLHPFLPRDPLRSPISHTALRLPSQHAPSRIAACSVSHRTVLLLSSQHFREIWSCPFPDFKMPSKISVRKLGTHIRNLRTAIPKL